VPPRAKSACTAEQLPTSNTGGGSGTAALDRPTTIKSKVETPIRSSVLAVTARTIADAPHAADPGSIPPLSCAPMNAIVKHVTRCLLAGALAILPVGGLLFALVFAEQTVSKSWLAKQPYYVPGMGIIAALLLVYALGLVATTFVGRWFWRWIDRVLEGLPAVGRLYVTLKQLLGYGEGEKAMFRRVVLVPREGGGHELGLVTNEVPGPDGRPRLILFLPGAPNPTGGRIVLTEASQVVAVSTPVHEVLKAMLSAGSTQLPLGPPGAAATAP
jgi:uncharacterized membrane protein